MPTDSLVVGDYKRAMFFRGQGYRVDVSAEAGTRWDYNLTGFRGEEEIAFDARPAVFTGYFQRIVNVMASHPPAPAELEVLLPGLRGRWPPARLALTGRQALAPLATGGVLLTYPRCDDRAEDGARGGGEVAAGNRSGRCDPGPRRPASHRGPPWLDGASRWRSPTRPVDSDVCEYRAWRCVRSSDDVADRCGEWTATDLCRRHFAPSCARGCAPHPMAC